MSEISEATLPVWADLLSLVSTTKQPGASWSHESEDLDLTLLCWDEGHRIGPYINDEVDNVLVGVSGQGIVEINGEIFQLRPGITLLIPKGCERAIESQSASFSYLSIHKRRRGLMPTFVSKSSPQGE